MFTDQNRTRTVMGILYSIAFGYCLYPKDGISGSLKTLKYWKSTRNAIDILYRLLSQHQAALL